MALSRAGAINGIDSAASTTTTAAKKDTSAADPIAALRVYWGERSASGD